MEFIKGHPTIRQLKRWRDNKNEISFYMPYESAPVSNVIILDLEPNKEGSNATIGVYKNRGAGNYKFKGSYKLKDIYSYAIPPKKDSILLKSNVAVKKGVILQFAHTSWYINRKSIAERSQFFHDFINKKEKELSAGKFFKWRKHSILIDLSNSFEDEHHFKLLLSFLDQNEIDDFIFTTKDALLLLEILNNYPLRKSSVSAEGLENELKNKFFELIAEGKTFTKPTNLGAKAAFFLENIEHELLAYAKRNNTQLCLNLLNYWSQIQQNNSVTIDSSLTYSEELRLLSFCNLNIKNLIIIGVWANVFKEFDLSSLPLNTLKVYPFNPNIHNIRKLRKLGYTRFFYLEDMVPLFNLISHSKTLRIVHIGMNIDNPFITKNFESSYIQEVAGYGTSYDAEVINKFKLLKTILDERIKPYYTKAAVSFFKTFVSQQESRIITSYLTLGDIEKLRIASPKVNHEIEESMNLMNPL